MNKINYFSIDDRKMSLANLSLIETKRLRNRFLSFLSICAFCSPVLADEYDTFQFRAGLVETHDNNLFRRASGEVSETITTKTIGMKIDKTYSLQRVLLDLNVIDNKYKNNDYLDFVAKNYNAAWFWSLTPEVTGVLSSERSQSLNSFGDVRITTQQNIRTLTMNQFRAQYSPHNVWALIAGFSQTSLVNSETFTAISDFDAAGFDYGLMYQFPSSSNIRFMGHNRRGDFTKRPLDIISAFDNGYSENEYEVELVMIDQSRSKLSGKFGYLKREYNNFEIRNYSSYVGDINYELKLTGKIKSTVGLSRLIAPFEATNSTYTLTDSARARLIYDVSSKVQAGLNLSYAERDFDGRGQFGSADRLDKERTYGLFLRWSPLRNVGITLNSSQSNRSSTISNFDFDSRITSINFDLRL